LHELAHSLVAKSRGLNVSSITLFIFGGVSNLQEEPKSAGTEFVMAVVGPLTSLILGGIMWGIGISLGMRGNPFLLFVGGYPQQTGPSTAMLYYLSSINIILGLFNLIPGFPLDGGRVLRSIIWGATKSLTRATNVATALGRYFGWALIVYGVAIIFISGNLGGILYAFIGWFLASAADSSRREVILREHLIGVKVKEVMNASPMTVQSSMTVDELVHKAFLQCHCRAAPVSYDSGVVGIVTLDDVKKIHKDRWTYTPVEAIMTREPIYSVSPEDDLNAAMQLLTRHDLNQLLVLQNGKLAGLITRSDILQHLQMSQELGVRPKQKNQ
jgi:Zn-dependent protease/CBS domain-containing protein